MNKHDKLPNRFCNLPIDFTFEDLTSLFASFGFRLENKGSTSGSRVIFVNKDNGDSYIMYKPHPANTVKGYSMRQVLNYLKVNGYISKEEK